MNYLLCGVIGMMTGSVLTTIDGSEHSKIFKWAVRIIVVLEALAAVIYVSYQFK